MVHGIKCRRCGEHTEAQTDETLCPDCETAIKCGFYDKNQLENATAEYLIKKYNVFSPDCLGFTQ